MRSHNYIENDYSEFGAYLVSEQESQTCGSGSSCSSFHSLPRKLQRSRQVLPKNSLCGANISVMDRLVWFLIIDSQISYPGPPGAQNSPVLLRSNSSMKDASVFAASSGVTAVFKKTSG